MTNEAALVQAFLGGIVPREMLTVSQWASVNRVLTTEASSASGQWDNDLMPQLVEPMDCLSPDSPYSSVVLKFPSQISGKTECGLNWMGSIVDQAPGPIIIVLPTLELCEGFSKQRLRHLFESSPALRGKVSDPRSRDSGNTLLLKEFPGGLMVLAGSNAAAKVAGWPCRYHWSDEINRHAESAGTEGPARELARIRLTSFGHRAKELITSTPTLPGVGIDPEYDCSSRGVYHMPCPRCGSRGPLRWELFRWDGDPRQAPLDLDVWYECAQCHGRVEEHEKTAMLLAGGWVHEFPERLNRGFWQNALTAPFGWIRHKSGATGWRALAAERAEAADALRTGDPGPMQVFVNTRECRAWEHVAGEAVEARSVLAHREDWGNTQDEPVVPARAVVLTSGTDVHPDRIETSIWAWAGRFERWLIAHHIIPNDPVDPATWDALDEIRQRPYPTTDGRVMRVAVSLVDAGYATQQVHDYCNPRRSQRVFAVHGQAGTKTIWDSEKRESTTSTKKKRKHRGWYHYFGTDAAGDEWHSHWQVERLPEAGPETPQPGYIHLPMWFSERMAAQMTAETRQAVRNKTTGRIIHRWVCPEGRRNEMSDCARMNLAGVHAWIKAGGRLDTAAPPKTLPPQRPASLPGRRAAPAEPKPVALHVDDTPRPPEPMSVPRVNDGDGWWERSW